MHGTLNGLPYLNYGLWQKTDWLLSGWLKEWMGKGPNTDSVYPDSRWVSEILKIGFVRKHNLGHVGTLEVLKNKTKNFGEVLGDERTTERCG
jgi:hypothetical protein